MEMKKQIKELLIKWGDNPKDVDKMIKNNYDLAIRRGGETPKELAKDIRGFGL